MEEKRVFETGAQRDSSVGKGRMDLLPWKAIIELSKHCERGAAHYGENNVRLGIPWHSLADSASQDLCDIPAVRNTFDFEGITWKPWEIP